MPPLHRPETEATEDYEKAIHAQEGAESGGGATEGAAAPHFDEADTADRSSSTGQEGS